MTADLSPLNVFRFCPRCGAPGFAQEGPFHLFCGACTLRYFINAAAAVAAVIDVPGKGLLLTRRAREPRKGMLDLPGGFVDPRERAETALRREIKEELGLDITEPRFFRSYPNRYNYGGLDYYTLDLAFLCRVEDWDRLSLEDEIESVVFIMPDSLRMEEIGFESVQNILRDYIERPR